MGRMTYVKALMCLLFPSAALVARAQHPVAGDLKCKLTGRMLMDGGVYLKNDNLFGNGTEFNDLRLGVKATYQNWSMKMEMGYVGNKVSIKDAFAAYTSGKHIIQVGQFYEPFTLDMLCSTYDLRFHQSPGISDLGNVKNISQGYAIDGRLVYRPVNEEGKLLHIGAAVVYRTPDSALPGDEDENTFIYKSPGVSTIDNRNLIYAKVDHAKYQLKQGVELMIAHQRFFLQGEYIRTMVKREQNFTNYTGHGGYVQCSWLLTGRQYGYDEALACPGRPVGRALELCGRFNILDMNNEEAGVWGGAQKDFSLGVNYYMNKHIGMKLAYSWVMPGKHIKEISDKNFSVVQLRFQMIL